MKKSEMGVLNKMTAEETEEHLLSPATRQATTKVDRASAAAAKSREKASKAADQTAQAAQSVTDTKAATKATLAEAKRERPRAASSRAIATADHEALFEGIEGLSQTLRIGTHPYVSGRLIQE